MISTNSGTTFQVSSVERAKELGISQDQQSLTVRPEIGWAVLEANQPNN